MATTVDVGGIIIVTTGIIVPAMTTVASPSNNGIYYKSGEVFPFASVIISSFNGFNVADVSPAPYLACKSVGNDVIDNVLREVLWGDLMRTQVHEASVGGDLILTQVHDTFVRIDHGNDDTAMHLNENGVADNDDYPLVLVIIVPELIDMHDRRVSLTRSCLMCGTDHVSWNEEFDRRLVYGEHRALLSDGEQSDGRELLSLGNGRCYYYDGLTETPSSFTVVFDDALTYGDGKGRSHSEDVISREFAASTWVPEWGEHEGVLTKQERERGEYLAIDRRIIVLRNLLVGIDDPYGFMSYEEHEPCNNGVGNSMYSWGAIFRIISRIYAATISVVDVRSPLQVSTDGILKHQRILATANEALCSSESTGESHRMNLQKELRELKSILGDSTEAILDGELVSIVTTSCSAQVGSDESSCTDRLSFMDCNDRVSLGWAKSTQQNDNAKQSLLWGATSTRFVTEVYDESGNDIPANNDWSKAWSIGSYFEYTTCGDDELTLGMDGVATPHGTDKDSLYFVAVNSSNNRVVLDGSSNPYSTVFGTRYTADSAFADYNCVLVDLFCGESSNTKDACFDAAIYTARTILERTRVKYTPLCLEVLSQEQHASSGLDESIASEDILFVQEGSMTTSVGDELYQDTPNVMSNVDARSQSHDHDCLYRSLPSNRIWTISNHRGVTNIAFGRVGMDSLLVRRNTGIFGFRMIVMNRRRKDHEMITQVELMIS
jgi:hypothetical protein